MRGAGYPTLSSQLLGLFSVVVTHDVIDPGWDLNFHAMPFLVVDRRKAASLLRFIDIFSHNLLKSLKPGRDPIGPSLSQKLRGREAVNDLDLGVSDIQN